VDLRKNLSNADACLFRVHCGSRAKPRGKLIGLPVLLFTGFVLNACGGGSSQPAAPTLIGIAVASQTVALGQPTAFVAVGSFNDGSHADITSAVKWVSVTTTVATIDSFGIAQSVGIGQTTIVASSGTVRGQAVLTVTAPVLVSIIVAPPSAALKLGQSQQLTVSGNFSDGSNQTIVSGVTWSVINTNANNPVLTVDSSGRVTGRVPGTASITAVCCFIPPSCDIIRLCGGFSGGATIQVLALKPHFAYAAVSNSLSVYPADPATGLWGSAASTITLAGQIRDIAFTPKQDFAYIATGDCCPDTNDTIAAYAVDPSTGALTALGAPTPVPPPASLHVHPSGNFLYATTTSSSLLAFKIDPASGALSTLPNFPMALGTPDVAIAPNGNFLYGVSTASPSSESVFAIDVAGGVTLVGSTAAPAGVLKLDPTGDFAVLALTLSASTYLADGNSGMLQLAGSGVFFRHPESANWSIEPSGRSVYDFATIDFCGIEEYGLDVQAGILADRGGITFPVCMAVSLTVDPSGQFVYAGILGGPVLLYSILNPGGFLTAIGSIPVNASVIRISSTP
jgi:6-phosphogluconolactonase (cycloisomerase 2 family)